MQNLENRETFTRCELSTRRMLDATDVEASDYGNLNTRRQ
jgi:hypothetical protein